MMASTCIGSDFVGIGSGKVLLACCLNDQGTHELIMWSQAVATEHR